MLNPTSRSTGKPGPRLLKLFKVRRKRPAPIRSSRESDTWATTRVFLSPPCPPPTTAPAWSFKVREMSGRVVLSAGTKPKKSPVETVTISVKRRMRGSGAAEMLRPPESDGRYTAISALSAPNANARPASAGPSCCARHMPIEKYGDPIVCLRFHRRRTGGSAGTASPRPPPAEWSSCIGAV